MEELKITPGEWRVAIDAEREIHVVAGTEQKFVAAIWSDEEFALADAHAIAAVPVLVAAVRAALDHVNGSGFLYAAETSALRLALMEALATAEGEIEP